MAAWLPPFFGERAHPVEKKAAHAGGFKLHLAVRGNAGVKHLIAPSGATGFGVPSIVQA